MDISTLERCYMTLGVALVVSYVVWTDSFGYSEDIFLLLLITLAIMAYLYILFFLHFEGPAEVNFY